MNPSKGQERSSVGCGSLWWMLTKLSRMGLVEDGGALLHEGFGEEKTSSWGVRETNTTVEGALFFSERKAGHRRLPGHWQAGLSTCFSSTSPIPSPTPLMNWCAKDSGAALRTWDLGREITDKCAAGCAHTDGCLGTGILWIPHGNEDGVRSLKLRSQRGRVRRGSRFVCDVLNFLLFISVNHRRKAIFRQPCI